MTGRHSLTEKNKGGSRSSLHDHRPPPSGEVGLAAKAAAAVAARNARLPPRKSSPCSTPRTPARPPKRSQSKELRKKPRESIIQAAAIHSQRVAPSSPKETSRSVEAPLLPAQALGFPRVAPDQPAVSTRQLRVDSERSIPESLYASSIPPEAASSPLSRKRPVALTNLSVRSNFSDRHTDVSMTPCATPMTCATPNAITDAALRRSEQLLADLTALGFSEAHQDISDAEENLYSCPSSSTASPTSRPLSPRDRPEDFASRRQDDMVEVPAAFLEHFVEICSKYQSMNQDADNQLQCADMDNPKAAQQIPHRDVELDGAWSPRLCIDSLASTMASVSSPQTSTSSPKFVDKANCGLLSPRSPLQIKNCGSAASTDVPGEFLSTFSSTNSSDSSIMRAIRRVSQAHDVKPCQMRRTSAPRVPVAQPPARVVVPAASLAPHGHFVQKPVTCTVVEQKITVTTTYHIH